MGHLEHAPQLDLVQRFPETPNCVAMHPTGLQVLVGFETSLQLMNVLMDSLRLFKEFPIRVSHRPPPTLPPPPPSTPTTTTSLRPPSRGVRRTART